MGNMELLSILVATITGMLSTIFLMINRSSARKNSNVSEKILFELKQVNDEVNHKIQETIEKTNSNQHGKSDRSKIVNNKSNEKIDQLIQNHHSQALSQSKIQFWFSLIAAVVGFIFIIIMVCVASTNVWYEYIVRILPGAIIEAVSVLFFSQSRETRERASDFLNRLREDKQYEKGIAIAESISDEKLKSTLKAEIALRLCGITDINIFENENNP